jgi:NADH-quinone oxidoreductase subunit K
MVPLGHYLILSAALFATGTLGVFLRRNVITVLLSIEVMLNAVNLATVAAAEAAIGLALVIALFRHRESLNPDVFTSLKW